MNFVHWRFRSLHNTKGVKSSFQLKETISLVTGFCVSSIKLSGIEMKLGRDLIILLFHELRFGKTGNCFYFNVELKIYVNIRTPSPIFSALIFFRKFAIFMKSKKDTGKEVLSTSQLTIFPFPSNGSYTLDGTGTGAGNQMAQ